MKQNLIRADIREVKKLEEALNLPTAKFHNTRVNPEQQAILEKAQHLIDTRFSVYHQ